MNIGRISAVNLYSNQNKKNKQINFQGRSIMLTKDPVVKNLVESARESLEKRSVLSKIWGTIRKGAKFRPGGILDANGNQIKNSFRADVDNFSGKIYLYRLNGDGMPETITQEVYRKGALKRVNTLDVVSGEEVHTYYGGKLDNGNRTVTTVTRNGDDDSLNGVACKNIDLLNLLVWEKDRKGIFTYYDRKNGWLRMEPDKGLQGYLKSDDAIYGFKHIGYPTGYIECRKSDLSGNLIKKYPMPRICGSIEAVLDMFKKGDLQRITSENCK